MPVITREVDEGGREQRVFYNEERRVEPEGRETHRRRDDKVTSETLAGGSTLELVGAGGAAVLAILALIGIFPLLLTAIASISIGGALLVHGIAIAARWKDTARVVGADRTDESEVAAGMGTEVLGGAAAIALGILALVGVVPFVLLAVSTIVLGTTILIGGPAQTALVKHMPDGSHQRATYRGVETASGTMVLAGLGAIVLGILALLDIGPQLTLVQVAMLAVGGATFLEAAALMVRFGRRVRRYA